MSKTTSSIYKQLVKNNNIYVLERLSFLKMAFDISELTEQNPWWIDKNNILKDPKLTKLSKLKFQWDPSLRRYIHLENDVIYTIRGPRQVGKTTTVKLIIKELLLKKNTKPENIFFWSTERNNKEELHKILQTFFDWRARFPDERKYIFIDEICSVDDWSHEIIYFANKGNLENCSLLLTGSHSMDIKQSTELMPGRRGGKENESLDKILVPMKFAEFVRLVWPEFIDQMFDNKIIKQKDKKEKFFNLFEGKISERLKDLQVYQKQLDNLLEIYLLTGGIPSAINEYFEKEIISQRTYNIYLTAMLGDLKRYNYKEHYFKQITREIFKTVANPISWNQFTKNTEIKSHNTVQEYISTIGELFIATTIYRISIHDQKAHLFMKKIYVQDPFIFHTLDAWSNGKKDFFKNAKANILNPEIKSKLIETVVQNHLCRFAYALNPSDFFDQKDHIFYYEDKNKKEVDFILKDENKLYPIEVKYQNQINSEDFFGFKAFSKGVIVTKNELGLHRNFVKIPVALFLLLI